MSPEQVTAMIQALGYPVCVSLAMFAVNWLLLKRYFNATDNLVKSTQEHAEVVAQISEKGNFALAQNSMAMKENTLAIKEMSGKLCRFPNSAQA